MKAIAPGKLILSGEHAVVYGNPALAIAVNRYVTATVTKQFLPFISFDLSDFSYRDHLSLLALKKIKQRIREKYQLFLQGEFKIRDVLQKPVELAQFALMFFFEVLNIKSIHGIKISVQSTIPVGCGMGSSAATILSITHALAHHLNIEINPEMLLKLGVEIENMQHGFSSGLDLQVSMQGGCLYTHNGSIESLAIDSFPMYLINTGMPMTSTGECVSHAAPYFKNSSIGMDFSAVTQGIYSGLKSENISEMKHLIQKNHQLLINIGVVPEKIQRFIKEIEFHDGAAKICGAGAIKGDQAGIVFVMTDDFLKLSQLCSSYSYDIIPISVEHRGAHVI